MRRMAARILAFSIGMIAGITLTKQFNRVVIEVSPMRQAIFESTLKPSQSDNPPALSDAIDDRTETEQATRRRANQLPVTSKQDDHDDEHPLGSGENANAGAVVDRVAVENATDVSINTLTQTPFPSGTVTARSTQPGGNVGTSETLGDGNTIFKTVSAVGELKGETWLTAAGEQIDRAYADSGRISALSWKRIDGTRIHISLHGDGTYQGRSDELPDGRKIVYRYDLSGNLVDRVELAINGAPL